MQIRKAMILVVDDDPTIRALLKKVLSEYSVITSCSSDALRIMAEGKVSLLITDFAMPDLDGLQLSKLAQKLYKIPAIIMTGHTDQLNYLRNRVADVIEKPFTIKDLKSIIIKTLDKQYENTV